MALGGFEFAIDLMSVGALQEFGLPSAEPHGPSLVGDILLLLENSDDGIFCIGVELRAIRVLKAADIAGEFDSGHLHSKA